jgi:phytoene desaturase
VHRQDGFTFDAGPTIITAPFLLEELWALAGRRKLADDVDLRPVDPFYRIRFDDGSWFDYSGDLAACAPRWRASARGRGRLRALRGRSRQSATAGLRRAGHIPSTLGDLLRAVPDLMKMRGWRSIYGMAASHVKRPQAAHGAELPPAADRRQPVSVTSVYSLINTLERRFGVHWAMGGTGTLVRGWSACSKAWAAGALNAEVRADHGGRGGPRHRRAAGQAASASRPTWWCPTPTPLDLPPPDRAHATAPLDRPPHRAAAIR